MRLSSLLVAAALGACASPNPAWLATETDPGSSGPGTASSGSTTSGSTLSPTSTSTGAPTTGGTLPTTGEPITTGPVTTGPDTTTGSGSTTGAPSCGFPDVADLELTYTTSLRPGCDPFIPRQAHLEVVGQSGASRWKFKVCSDDVQCKDPNVACVNGEEIILSFNGPPELMPGFVPGECHQMHALARGPDPNDPQSCKLRVLRLAHTRFTPYATHYIGAIHVPGTAGLPGMGQWLGLPGFSLASKLDEPCADDLNCQPPAGSYLYELSWGDPPAQHTVVEGASFPADLVVHDLDQNEVVIGGALTSLRARIDLAPMCGEAQDFKWVWLAQVPAP